MFNSDLPADSSKIRYSAGYIRANFKAIEAALGPGLTIFPSGTTMWFFQDSAPIGWTAIMPYGDALLGIKGDSNSPCPVGGVQVGTWQQSDHQLTIDEMPSHNHRFDDYGQCGTNPGNPYNMLCYNNAVGQHYVQHTGGDRPHNHGNSWRPKTIVGIIARRD